MGGLDITHEEQIIKDLLPISVRVNRLLLSADIYFPMSKSEDQSLFSGNKQAFTLKSNSIATTRTIRLLSNVTLRNWRNIILIPLQ